MNLITDITQEAYPVQGELPIFPNVDIITLFKEKHENGGSQSSNVASSQSIKLAPTPISRCSSESYDTVQSLLLPGEEISYMTRMMSPSRLVVRRTSVSKCMSLSDMSIIPLDDPIPQRRGLWRHLKQIGFKVGRVWISVSYGFLTVFEIISWSTAVSKDEKDDVNDVKHCLV